MTVSEYKALRQYQAVGYVLDEFRAYGYKGGIESLLSGRYDSEENGHDWLIK